MRSLGLDLSITCTGWSIIDHTTLLAYGKIETKKLKTTNIRVRLKYIILEIDKIIKEFSPTTVVIEDVYQGINAKTVAILNRLNGAVVTNIPMTIEVNVTNVSHARKVVLGSGKKHDKKEVFDWSVKKYKLKDFKFTKHNDITDSILLAEWGCIKQLTK